MNTISKFLRISLMLVGCFMFFKSFAQPQPVQIIINVLPPYSYNVTDYQNHPEQIIIKLINTSNTNFNLQLGANIVGVSNGVSVKTKNGYRSGQSFSLPANTTKDVDANTVSKLFNLNSFVFTGIDINTVMQTGAVPEGDYQICIRAYDYNTLTPVSNDAPIGCSNIFSLKAIEPPVIVNPISTNTVIANATQNIIINWTIPPSAPANTNYILRMVEVPENRNAQDAMLSNTVLPFFERNVSNNVFIYDATQPILTKGKKYALMVKAIDPLGKVTFRNSGNSEIIWFKYGDVANDTGSLISPKNILTQNIECPINCKVTAPNGAANNNIKVGDKVKVKGGENFEMTITSIVPDGASKKFKGTGVIAIPFLHNNVVKVKVNFWDATFTTDANIHKMMSGFVKASRTKDANLIPNIETIKNITKPNMLSLMNMAKNNSIDNINNNINSIGYELPIGFTDKNFSFAITDFSFESTQAKFSIATTVDVPDANDVLVLAAQNICMNDENNLCGNFNLSLMDSFTIAPIHLTLLPAKEIQSATPSGTYMSISKSLSGSLKLDRFHVGVAFTAPENTLIDDATNKPLTAQFEFDANNGWANWMTNITLPKFYVYGLNDIKFGPTTAIYDHSDISNYAEMKTVYKSSDKNEQDYKITPQWHGIFIPKITIAIPEIIKAHNNNNTTTFMASNMLFDDKGFTGNILATNILSIGEGSLAGWYATIDSVGLEFFKSNYKSGGMAGTLALPLTGNDVAKDAATKNVLNYNCLLTYQKNVGTQNNNATNSFDYQFLVKPKNNLNFSALFMKMQIDENSNILIKKVNKKDNQGKDIADQFEPFALADISGNVTLDAANGKSDIIQSIQTFTFPQFKFEHFVLQTRTPYLDDSKFKCSFPGASNLNNIPSNTSIEKENNDYYAFNGAGPFAPLQTYYFNENYLPQAPNNNSSKSSVAGFNINIDAPSLFIEPGINGATKLGLRLGGKLDLMGGKNNALGAEASTKFSVYTNLFYDLNKSHFSANGFGAKLEDLNFGAAANFGPVHVAGKIKYYNNTDNQTEGLAGALKVEVQNLFSIKARANFGTKNPGTANSFNYFDFYALADLGQTGVPMFPGTALYGFGGGIFYNESLDETQLPKQSGITNKTEIDSASASQKTGLEILKDLESPSAAAVHPDKGKFGITATVLFGLTKRANFNADATLTAVINLGDDNGNGGGLQQIAFKGNGRVLTDETYTDVNAVGVGTIDASYDFERSVFDLHSTAEMGVPHHNDKDLLYSQSPLEFHIDKNIWHLKMGMPFDGKYNHLQILKVISADSYFEIGNKIDNAPGIPNELYALAGNSNIDFVKNNITTASRDKPATTSGFIHGAYIKFDYSGNFLMFDGSLKAMAGYDIALINAGTTNCAISQGNKMGFNGYYAQGDAFLGAHANINMNVEMFGKRRFNIMDIGAAAAVKFGLPNPSWIVGAIAGHYSVLDDLINGDFNFKFQVGDKNGPSCKVNASLLNFPIISDISPDDKTKDVDLLTQPVISFNLKPNTDFEVKETVFSNGKNTIVKKGYSFTNNNQHQCIKIEMNGVDVTNNFKRGQYQSNWNTMTYQPTTSNFLEANKQYTLKVTVKIWDKDNNKWVPKTAGSKEDFIETKTIVFNTMKGFKSLPDYLIAKTVPLHSHLTVPYKQFDSAYIELKAIVDPEKQFDTAYFGSSNINFAAIIYKNGVRQPNQIPIKYKDENNAVSKKWIFTQIPVWEPSSFYRVEIIAAKQNTITQGGIRKQINYYNDNGLSNTVNFQSYHLTGTTQLAQPNKVITAFEFTTSKYATYQNKINSRKKHLMIIYPNPANGIYTNTDSCTISTDNSPLQNKMLLDNWMKYQDTLNTRTTAQRGFALPAWDGVTYNLPYIAFVMKGDEFFSKADDESVSSDDVFKIQTKKGFMVNKGLGNLYSVNKGITDSNEVKAWIAANTGINATKIIFGWNYLANAAANTSIPSYCSSKPIVIGSNSSEYHLSDIGKSISLETNYSPNNSSMIILGFFVTTTNGMLKFISSGEQWDIATSGVGIPITYYIPVNCHVTSQTSNPIQTQIAQVINPAPSIRNTLNNVNTWQSVSGFINNAPLGNMNAAQIQAGVGSAINSANR